jgi:hypothetical protein
MSEDLRIIIIKSNSQKGRLLTVDHHKLLSYDTIALSSSTSAQLYDKWQ